MRKNVCLFLIGVMILAEAIGRVENTLEGLFGKENTPNSLLYHKNGG